MALEAVLNQWWSIGIGLGLGYDKLESIKQNYPRDQKSCLGDMIAIWLKEGYDVKRHGEPTWRKLVSVVETEGTKPCAKKIADKHIQPEITSKLQTIMSDSAIAIIII